MDAKEILNDLYAKISKHSGYQIIHEDIQKIINLPYKPKINRYEKERYEFITSCTNISNKSVLEIGGNLGYFTISLLRSSANKIYYYEGNKDLHDFLIISAKLLNLIDKIEPFNEYYTFQHDHFYYDIVLLLNVLHHTGSDYNMNTSDPLKQIIGEINSLSINSNELILQLGFNWMGDINKPLFKNGTKKEMIDRILKDTKDKWSVVKIGIPVLNNDKIEYEELNDKNIQRNDRLGEFLNRPLFYFRLNSSLNK